MRAGGLDHLTAALAFREQSHRRATLVAIGALLLLSTSPVFGHHLPLAAHELLAGVDHLGALCLTALHHLLAPVHDASHVILLAGLLFAVVDRVRAWRRVRRVLAPLDCRLPAAGDAFWIAARSVGLDPRRLRIVSALPNPAFTVGLLSPTVYAAEELAERLSADELAAVLAHEGAHVRRRDPLRLSLLRGLACALFWIPALRRLADDVADEAEVSADDAAARGRPLVLASAILTLAQWSRPAAAGATGVTADAAVGFQGRDLLDRRVRRLAGEAIPVRSHVTRRSVLGAGLALSVVWASGVLMAHPLPMTAHAIHERHCEHRYESAFAHLFCLGSPFAASASSAKHCPHRDL